MIYHFKMKCNTWCSKANLVLVFVIATIYFYTLHCVHCKRYKSKIQYKKSKQTWSQKPSLPTLVDSESSWPAFGDGINGPHLSMWQRHHKDRRPGCGMRGGNDLFFIVCGNPLQNDVASYWRRRLWALPRKYWVGAQTHLLTSPGCFSTSRRDIVKGARLTKNLAFINIKSKRKTPFSVFSNSSHTKIKCLRTFYCIYR